MVDSDDVTPAWGALPLEQYLIRKWDHSSELSADEQRAELVEAYIDEDLLDPELLESPPSRVPTEAEIAEILAPWRPQKLRRIAAAHLIPHNERFYFLRTHYGGGEVDDAKLRAWVDDDTGPQFDPPENEWFCVLNDAELFDVGDYWQDVYDIFPELAAPKPDRRFTEYEIGYARKMARRKAGGEEPSDEHYEAAILLAAAKREPPWLLVLDEKAFKENELGLILQDNKGETELGPGHIDAWHISWTRGMLPESGYWQYGRVGHKYRTRGKMMRKLLPIVRGDPPAEAATT